MAQFVPIILTEEELKKQPIPPYNKRAFGKIGDKVPPSIWILRKEELWCASCGNKLAYVLHKYTSASIVGEMFNKHFFKYWCSNNQCEQFRISIEIAPVQMFGEL